MMNVKRNGSGCCAAKVALVALLTFGYGAGVHASETIGSLTRKLQQFNAEITAMVSRGDYRATSRYVQSLGSLATALLTLKVEHMENDLDDSDTGDFLTLRKLKRRLAAAETAVDLARVYATVENLRMTWLRNTYNSRNPFDPVMQRGVRATEGYSKYVLDRADELSAGERNAFFGATIASLSARMGAGSAGNIQTLSAGSVSTRNRISKGYCARHNCHYKLTDGCHFCEAPNFGDTNPWRLRGNWDRDI